MESIAILNISKYKLEKMLKDGEKCPYKTFKVYRYWFLSLARELILD